VLNQTAKGARSRARALLLSWARPLAVVLAGSLAASCAQSEDGEAVDALSDPAAAVGLFAGIRQENNILGEPSAPVTLVEFSDLRCSHCRDFAQISLPVLVNRYVRTGRVRIVFGNLPILGPSSTQAARMAASVGLQNHLFEFVEVFYAQASGAVTDDLLSRIAGDVPGVDVEEALAERSSAAVSDALTAAKNEATHFSITGTPTVLLGKTGTEPHELSAARATKPDTLTGPIDDLLAGH
jgi:protein-disulfide isomerase